MVRWTSNPRRPGLFAWSLLFPTKSSDFTGPQNKERSSCNLFIVLEVLQWLGMSAAKIPHRRPIRAGKNSTVGEKTAEKVHSAFASIFGGRRVISIVILFVVIIAIVGGILWFNKVYTNPEHVFWSMIDNNLSVKSVTKETDQQGSGISKNELTQLSFNNGVSVRDVREVKSGTGNAASKIKIESIGTLTDTYQHYVLIDQPVKSGQAKPDYSKVYPLWIKNSGPTSKIGDTQLLNSAIFSAFFFGNLSSVQRTDITKHLQAAYKVDFDKVEQNKDNGRKTYTYKVTLDLQDYAKAAQAYAKALKLPNAAQINPNNYKPTDQLAVSVKVDVLSRQIREIAYQTSSVTEKYSSYGVITHFSPPAHTVSYNDLQKAVTEASQ